MNIGDKVMATKEYNPEDKIEEIKEPVEAYLQSESDMMTDEEFEEALSRSPYQQIPGLPYTHEERMAELREDMAKHLRGEDDSITQEDFIKELEEEGW